jgi:putative transcriptional regulator
VGEGAWWVVEGTPDDVLGGDPDGRWTAIVRRQRGELAWFAHHPADPTAN